MTDHDSKTERVPTNPNNAGGIAAMHGAAVNVRRAALVVSGSVVMERDGKTVYESDPNILFPDGVDEESPPTG